MASYTDPAHADGQIREASRHLARLGTAWFGFAQVLFIACFVLVGGGDEATSDLDAIDLATYVAAGAAAVFVAFTVLSFRVDRAGDVPPPVRDDRLADQQSAWVVLTLISLAQIALAVFDLVARS